MRQACGYARVSADPPRLPHVARSVLAQTGGKPTLLPRMQPLGDIDEDEWLFADTEIEADIPPAITPMRRRLLLAQLIKHATQKCPSIRQYILPKP